MYDPRPNTPPETDDSEMDVIEEMAREDFLASEETWAILEKWAKEQLSDEGAMDELRAKLSNSVDWAHRAYEQEKEDARNYRGESA